MAYRQTNIRIPPTLHERISKLAGDARRSFNQQVTDLLEEAVALQERERQEVTRHRVTRVLQEGGYDDGIIAQIKRLLRGE